MNVLFISLLDFSTFDEHNIYTDLLLEFIENKHKVFAISPVQERRKGLLRVISVGDSRISKPFVGPVQKSSYIRKGIAIILLESKIRKAVIKSFGGVKFDLILYTTPPVTFAKTIAYVKRRDKAKTYLLLKDIFPQNAVDLGALSEKGFKGLFFKFFKSKERKLYSISDIIGVMSPKNKEYLRQHNSYINTDKIEVNPNSERPIQIQVSSDKKKEYFELYQIPTNKKVLVYGGNLGPAQGVDFILKCVEANEKRLETFLVIVGSGTEFMRVNDFIVNRSIVNSILIPKMPRERFEILVSCCDIGLVFLDYRFTIPNFPSRLLTYMQCKKPVIVASDPNTDIGTIVEHNQFGYFCYSNSVQGFFSCVDRLLAENLIEKGINSYRFFSENFTSKKSYDIIMKHLK